MTVPISDRRHAIQLGRRVGSWLLKGVAGMLCFALWFSWTGYGRLVDGAMVVAAALLVWLAWIVEGKP
jgi:hypothetical protein